MKFTLLDINEAEDFELLENFKEIFGTPKIANGFWVNWGINKIKNLENWKIDLVKRKIVSIKNNRNKNFNFEKNKNAKKWL